MHSAAPIWGAPSPRDPNKMRPSLSRKWLLGDSPLEAKSFVPQRGTDRGKSLKFDHSCSRPRVVEFNSVKQAWRSKCGGWGQQADEITEVFRDKPEDDQLISTIIIHRVLVIFLWFLLNLISLTLTFPEFSVNIYLRCSSCNIKQNKKVIPNWTIRSYFVIKSVNWDWTQVPRLKHECLQFVGALPRNAHSAGCRTTDRWYDRRLSDRELSTNCVQPSWHVVGRSGSRLFQLLCGVQETWLQIWIPESEL